MSICDVNSEEEFTYKIVGVDEADIKKIRLSVASPLSKALIGHEVGDEVSVTTANGKKVFEITEIKYV